MILFITLACLNLVHGFDVESYEVNRVENDYSPFYDMIVYNDIADILNEFDTKGGHPIEAIIRSESDSDENVDDLLSEYQRHIEKIAHDVENLKRKTTSSLHRDNYYATDVFSPIRLPPRSQYHNLFGFPMPLNPSAGDKSITWKLDSANSDDTFKSLRTFDTSPQIHKTMFDQSCFCRKNKLPCECDCKLCIMPMDMLRQNTNELRNLPNDFDDYRTPEIMLSPFSFNPERPYKDFNIEQSKPGENNLNIKIKVEIQMPETSNSMKGKHCKNHTKTKSTMFHDGSSIEITPSTVSVPTSYMQYPIPLEMLGLNRKSQVSRPQSVALQKVGIHKKKRSKLNNNIKKHRKKVVTFHDITFRTPERLIPAVEESYSLDEIKAVKQNMNTNMKLNTNSEVNKDAEQKATPRIITESVSTIEPQKEEKLTVTLNLINDKENATDETKLENQIMEAGVFAEELKLNATNNEEKVLRTKRDIGASATEKENQTITHTREILTKLKGIKVIIKDKDASKKYELKSLLADSELLYWPSISKTHDIVNSNNITTLIMERENKKTKLNISKDVIRNNRTKAIEKAIFGDVNWNDINAVAPMFMSFVGKYVRGVLTFCSESICHSMKCAEKVCLHRTCQPDHRLNRRGHCNVDNTTESVVSMESIMDLPSNVAFEIVDILQENLPGKIYGKCTLCISGKCISFVAAKKLFSKNRCSIKDLNSLGHCTNVKNFKSVE